MGRTTDVPQEKMKGMRFIEVAFVLNLLITHCHVVAFPKDVYVDEYKWIQEGDVNIGAILTIHSLDPQSLVSCTKNIQDIRNVQNVEALSFAVQEINSRSDILSNISLGFVILDDCSSSSMALAHAIQFMPRNIRMKGVCPVHGKCAKAGRDDVFYDVAGVIGTYTSKLSIVVANVLNLFQMPQISHTATSNILSDKSRFPYFFRMVPPDKYQAMVISSLLRYFNWSHVSIVYSEGSYGREGVKELQSRLQSSESSMCIEDILEIGYRFTEEEILPILERLNSRSDTKVVIAFVEIDDGKALSSALKSAGLVNRFVWIGSDSISLTIEEHPSLCQSFPGSFSVQPHFRHIERFQDHLKELNTPKGKLDSKNPWLHELASQSLNYGPEGIRQSILVQETEAFIRSSFVDSFLIDSVYAFAFAIDSVIKKRCPNAVQDKRNLTRCISGAGIYSELKHIRFNGSLGESEFNENGDIMTKYKIYQCSSNLGDYMNLRQIGVWEMTDERLHVSAQELSWPRNSGVPFSSCPKPCTETVGTIFYFTKQTCCHVCVTCKVNEIVTANATRCEVCPEFSWPNQNRQSCVPIQPFYFGLDNAVSIGLCAVAVSGVIICLCVGAVIIKYREEHVVKSTSVELSSLILLGTCLTFVLTGSFLSRPNNYKCYINNVGFSLTFTIVYGPLLVKTNRIYRIFNAGKRTTMRPCFISKSSQVFISLFLIFLQVGVVIVSTSLHPPEVILHMPSKTEEFVELFCNLPSECLLSSLSYNLVLVVICTFYAFKTRKLPDNYKESRYIAYCVDTTLLIWITFVPTYFTTSRAAAKVTILSVSLLLNASVTIACLFIPRIHSLYKSLRSTCSGNGHHYKDFRIVKHVVKRKRSIEVRNDLSDPVSTTRRVSSAVTITSDLFQNIGDVTISVAQSTQTCLEMKETNIMTPVDESEYEEKVTFS